MKPEKRDVQRRLLRMTAADRATRVPRSRCGALTRLTVGWSNSCRRRYSARSPHDSQEVWLEPERYQGRGLSSGDLVIDPRDFRIARFGIELWWSHLHAVSSLLDPKTSWRPLALAPVRGLVTPHMARRSEDNPPYRPPVGQTPVWIRRRPHGEQPRQSGRAPRHRPYPECSGIREGPCSLPSSG
jgi:hypothetical protein